MKFSSIKRNVKTFFGINSAPVQKQKETDLDTKTLKTEALSDITPAMYGIKINSKYEDLKAFASVISKYQYGKSSMIQNPTAVSVYSDDKNFYIKNFYKQDCHSQNEGICEELTFKAGNELREKFGDRYIFIPVKGSFDKYNMHHYYITAFRKTDENEAKIQKILDCDKKCTDIAMSFLENCDNLDEKMTTINQLTKQSGLMKKEMLQSAVLIDPSFHTVCEFDMNGHVSGYTQDLFCNFEDMNPYKSENAIYSKKILPLGLCIPIGFSKDLNPQKDSEELLFLNIFERFGKTKCNILSMKPDSCKTKEVNLKKFPELKKFVQKLSQ